MTDRLYRSPTDRVIAGVAGGLAVWLNVDPSVVRVVWVLLALLTGGAFVIVYLVMMIVIPLPPVGWVPQHPVGGAPGPWPSGWGGWRPGGWTPGGWTPGGQPAAGQAPTSQPPAPDGTGSSWTTPPPPSGWDPASVGSGRAAIVVGALLILVGAWFLIDRYIDIDTALVGPAIVIIVGAGLIVLAMTRNRPPA